MKGYIAIMAIHRLYPLAKAVERSNCITLRMINNNNSKRTIRATKIMGEL